jgi:two-component system NtrC family response regulator
MAKVLIIDDDTGMCGMMSRELKYGGHDVTTAFNLKSGLAEASRELPDVIFLDVRMPDGNGIEMLPTIKETASSPEVVIITGFANSDSAEMAIKSGAWDYLKKPFSTQDIKLTLSRALQFREEKRRNGAFEFKRDRIIGKSPKIKDCLELMSQAAISEANVLITGETGTGKELVALAIHENSPRANNDFVVLDCTVLPDTLVESMLFGHKKGSFTGASSNKEGLFKQADGGTLFLDEVGELSFSLQKAFLRVIQEHSFRPIGGKQEIKSNFRLVAATNLDLDQMVKSNKFRKDLHFRLQTLNIDLPPLRERSGDIKDLAVYHMTKLCKRSQIPEKSMSPEILEALNLYNWPGNIRELVNAIDWALTVARHEPILFAHHLPKNIRIQLARDSVKEASTTDSLFNEDSGDILKLRDVRAIAIADVEKEYLRHVMHVTGGDIGEACHIAGLSRSQLYNLLKKYKDGIILTL